MLKSALIANIDNTSVCGTNPIMSTNVTDSEPYFFYALIIENCLVGVAVIFVIWEHIDRYLEVINDEEIRPEADLSRRVATMAATQRGNRVDSAVASKGLCGLLVLVASVICLTYSVDVSLFALMVLTILATLIGFKRGSKMRWSADPPSYTEPIHRMQSLEFHSEEQSDLNDILLRLSAFGQLTYAVFSVVAGGMGANMTQEPNFLIMFTGTLTVLQALLQLHFIADVSRRKVPLPEQECGKPARQAVNFLLICNVIMWLIYTIKAQQDLDSPVEFDMNGFVAWSVVQRFTLPLCVFHCFHSAMTLGNIWNSSNKTRVD
ncbi:proton channel OtopLc isoform X2 [Pieris rapae]|uniref:proton channel OtopLc isoform X2 n=1 Tax=Pieris rapae TaxID=64459 RepID=UPI001E281ACF|nr:proton channel OtopLc isoform X2 [Pieris rapae]